ncbi:MAG: LacI family transcriptional regulator [Candidatus Binatia bacterium]|jgi:LacI family transcriptional regulator
MIRLKDIAERAGVSVMTVSKVMRDARDISAPTKAKVRALATEMGYMPDSNARGLRNKSVRIFGLLISSTTNPIFARMLVAIEQRVSELGFELMLGLTMNSVEREEQCIRRFLSRRIDGLFIRPVYRMEPSAPVYNDLVRLKVATVLLGQAAPFCKDFHSVAIDDIEASQKATRHLLELGHRRIAFLAGSQFSPEAQERFEGYRRALQEANVAFDERLVFQAGNTIEEGRAAALEILNELPGFTALQGANDLVAIGAAGVLLDQGLKIPTDVSVVGFGNVLTAEHFRVPLTTVRQPKFRMGVAAVESMQTLLAGDTPEPRRLPAEIVIRASTGPPPKKMRSK